MIARLLPVLLLAGCAATATPADYYARNHIHAPTPDGFAHCRFYGCQKIDRVALRPKEWAQIKKIMTSKTPEQERENIARAVAAFETIVGGITGTSADKAGTYSNPGPYQQDCIDESTNTTIYLDLLAQKGWLKFHDVNAPTTRVPFGVGVFVAHRTAVITERETGERYAVDSWFHDNGAKAEIVPVREWKARWHPPADAKGS